MAAGHIFRLATELDLDRKYEILTVVNNAYLDDGWATANYFVAGNRSTLAEIEMYLKNDKERFFIALNAEQQVVGTVKVECRDAKAFVGILAVRADCQSKGIARALMNIALLDAQTRGCVAAVMDVVDSRTSLLAWYYRLGFQDTGVREDMYHEKIIGGHVRMIILEKPLG
ncbi:acyl-CoA N-acyltransferase [Hesseltinella vesiculosa]|uniref:Acyl-CoA N-acyltransferase n=1 Tax=Hesseltinella vesiculosa TaxID=101127 RepID=A0A1X2GF54_9FUNG|nr:acyl-CoA N-acyltransferase [Hesseltinella vesiculosa]